MVLLFHTHFYGVHTTVSDDQDKSDYSGSHLELHWRCLSKRNIISPLVRASACVFLSGQHPRLPLLAAALGVPEPAPFWTFSRGAIVSERHSPSFHTRLSHRSARGLFHVAFSLVFATHMRVIVVAETIKHEVFSWNLCKY